LIAPSLPPRVHRLQHDEQTLLVLGVQLALQVLDAQALLLELPEHVLFLLVVLGLVGVYGGQHDPLPR
jgi:hypothetical protein